MVTVESGSYQAKGTIGQGPDSTPSVVEPTAAPDAVASNPSAASSQPAAPTPSAVTQAALDARAAAQAAQQPVLTRQQRIADLCIQQFLRIEEMPPGSTFSHRGTCSKCGWQSMQHTKEDAFDMVSKHVMQHWKDVVGML